MIPPRRPAQTSTSARSGATSPSSRSAPALAPTSPVPEPVRAALAAVVRDLRDIPRELIGDPAEVVHFLARAARRLEGIRAMRVPASLPAPPAAKPPSAVLMAPIGATAALQAAERTFAGVPKVSALGDTFSTSTRKSAELHPGASRLVIGRRGRPVPVVLRRARAAGQIELPI